jgi:hypothetical protein
MTVAVTLKLYSAHRTPTEKRAFQCSTYLTDKNFGRKVVHKEGIMMMYYWLSVSFSC